jgi:hypothetical protein
MYPLGEKSNEINGEKSLRVLNVINLTGGIGGENRMYSIFVRIIIPTSEHGK